MPTAAIRDLMMYYEEAGRGDPLVLIMGLGSDSQAWGLTVPALAKHFRVVTFDNRGAGRTSAPDRPSTIAQMADDTVALMDHLGIGAAHVLGFNMGGFIAQELAIKHPAKVMKLILLGTSDSVDGYTRSVIESLMAARRSNLSREAVARLTACWLYSPELLDDRGRFERAIQNSLNNPHAQQDHAYIRQAQAVLGFDARERLKNIKSEVLVVSSADDILYPARNAERLAKGLAKATSVTLPGGHAGALENASDYNEAFLQFLGAAVPA